MRISDWSSDVCSSDLREGRLAEGAAAQMDQAWRNILAILDDAGMDAGNLVKITAYLTRRDDLKAFREMRDRHLTDVKPASTLLIVSGLADPGWLVEIEALAAKSSGRRGPANRDGVDQHGGMADADRTTTRLNSSHQRA